jgi:hypothetical protein
MPSRKQRRRRQKQHRHEWEEVYVDEEGRELEPDAARELKPAREARGTKGESAQRGRRKVEPPSWRRTLRRGLLFFPLMLLVIFLLPSELSTAGKVVNALVLMAFFLPFSYFMDSVVWRSYQRRLAKSDESKKR